ncbi:MAG: FliA/WhiG family RNA polymerase sigma factor [Deltaproteobacteria bacterium]|nr:MAG: FliA/WhiG family RNA polymerase sigma factor [Deltaproteobacteria bacterium]
MPSTCSSTGRSRVKARALSYHPYSSANAATCGNEDRSLTREEMILKYTPLIKYIAHRLAMRLPPHIAVDDLINSGVIGLMDAINKFDPNKKVQFKTYAEFRIKGAMLDELRSLDWVSRSVRQKAAQLERAFQSLEKKKGRAVEDPEVAQELGISLENYYTMVNEINGVFLTDLSGVRKKMPQFSDEDLLNLLADDKENQPFQLLSLEELKEVLTRAIEELTPKERTVISLYYYEELTLKEIGEVLGFTESRICQIHTKAVLKLRNKVRYYMKDAG